MLSKRLIFGSLMTIAFVAIVLFDGWFDGSFTQPPVNEIVFHGTLITILVALSMIPGLFELSKFASAKGIKILLPVSIPASILIVSSSWWLGLLPISPVLILYILLSLFICISLLYQYLRYGLTNVFANTAAACFSVLYLGVLASFIPAVHIDFGPLNLLMLVFVVKACDIGAYTAGSLFGKHKFSPVISPKKTWEGMAGVVFLSILVAVAFAVFCDIMPWWLGVIFAVLFAFIGQLGDLAESMLKRDAEMKDSSKSVPGFGGILDVVDSLLVTAPFGYVFFALLR
jgi:phosphatidate cytidylyltransferase